MLPQMRSDGPGALSPARVNGIRQMELVPILSSAHSFIQRAGFP